MLSAMAAFDHFHSGHWLYFTMATAGVCSSYWLERQNLWMRYFNLIWPKLVSWQVFRTWCDLYRVFYLAHWATIYCDRIAFQLQQFGKYFVYYVSLLYTHLHTTHSKQFNEVSAHVVPGIFLICITYVSDWPYLCVAFITLSLGMNGVATVTDLQNSQDLAPNYAAVLYSIINAISVTTGFITPLIVTYFTQERVMY